MMVEPFQVLLGLLGVFFAHFLGRSGVRLARRQAARARFIAWLLRTAACLYAVVWFGGFRLVSIVVLALAALSLAWGVFDEYRPKKEPEDLTKLMFPPG